LLRVGKPLQSCYPENELRRTRLGAAQDICRILAFIFADEMHDAFAPGQW